MCQMSLRVMLVRCLACCMCVWWVAQRCFRRLLERLSPASGLFAPQHGTGSLCEPLQMLYDAACPPTLSC